MQSVTSIIIYSKLYKNMDFYSFKNVLFSQFRADSRFTSPTKQDNTCDKECYRTNEKCRRTEEETANSLFHGQTLHCTRLLFLLGVMNAVRGITDINIAPTFIYLNPLKFIKVALLKITHRTFTSSLTFVQPKQPNPPLFECKILPFF